MILTKPSVDVQRALILYEALSNFDKEHFRQIACFQGRSALDVIMDAHNGGHTDVELRAAIAEWEQVRTDKILDATRDTAEVDA